MLRTRRRRRARRQRCTPERLQAHSTLVRSEHGYCVEQVNNFKGQWVAAALHMLLPLSSSID
jgi:hypothetical protein